MAIISYLQIIDAIENVVNAHGQIKGFYVGRDYEALEDERNKILFPLIQIQPVVVDIMRTNLTSHSSYPTVVYTFRIRVLDMVDKAEDNKKFVYSNTEQMLQHHINWVSHHPWFRENKLKITSDIISCLPEEYNNNLNACGWYANISFKIENWDGYCGQPFSATTAFSSVVEKAYYNLINSLGGSIASNVPLTANTLTNIIAPDSTVNVVYSDDQELIYSGTVASNTTETIEIDRPTCADANYTVNLDSVVYSAGTIAAGETQIVNVTSAAGYTPPVDWGWEAAAALIDEGDDAFVGAFAVTDGFDNNISLRFYFDGTGVIDWGDGSAAEVVTSSVAINHTFNYAGIPSAVTSRGFKLAKVLFTADSNFINFSPRQYPGEQLYQAEKILAIKIRTTTAGRFTYNFTDDNAQQLEILDLGTIDLNIGYLFYNHKNLKKLIFKFGSATSAPYLQYLGGAPDINWNSLDWTKISDMSNMFAYSSRGESYNLRTKINACTTLYNCFRQQFYFNSIELLNTSLVTDISYCIYNTPIQNFVLEDASAVITTTGFVANGGQYQKLKRLYLKDLTVGIDLSNQSLTATALNNFFDGLGTANGAQTITITGCLGAATCDTTIATNKGYTVVN